LLDETQRRQIVGVARTANYTAWGEPPQFCVYVPLEQNSDTLALYVRTKGDPLQQIVPGEREIHSAFPQVAVSNPRTGRQNIDGGLFLWRLGGHQPPAGRVLLSSRRVPTSQMIRLLAAFCRPAAFVAENPPRNGLYSD
jgi:hypothetical protein